MKAGSKNKKRFVSIFLIATIVLSLLSAGCGSPSHRGWSFRFDPLTYAGDKALGTMDIGRFRFHFTHLLKIRGHLKTLSLDSLIVDFEKRFAEHLLSDGINPMYDEKGRYSLDGNFVVSRRSHLNGWVALDVPITMLIITIPLMVYIPANTYEYQIAAVVIVTDNETGAVVLNRPFDTKYKIWFSPYHLGNERKPDSKINRSMVSNIDPLLRQISEAVSQAVAHHQTRRTPSGKTVFNRNVRLPTTTDHPIQGLETRQR